MKKTLFIFLSVISTLTITMSCSDDDDNNVRYQNKKIYGKLETDIIYKQAIIDYISGMTDRYAIEIFNELIRF